LIDRTGVARPWRFGGESVKSWLLLDDLPFRHDSTKLRENETGFGVRQLLVHQNIIVVACKPARAAACHLCPIGLMVLWCAELRANMNTVQEAKR